MSSRKLEIFLSRWFHTPPALTFRAFVEPALLEQWFCPSPEVALRVQRCDARAGGQYRFVFYFPDGRVVPVVGEYLTVESPHKLAFTWTWEEPDPWAGVVTLVSVHFWARDGGTQVDVRHEELGSSEMKQMHESGWNATILRLEEVLRQMSGGGRESDKEG